MCGIAGLWDVSGRITGEERSASVRRMTQTLRHRGPDDEGYFDEPEAGLSIGHRRLSIIDLSPSGRQPMASPSGRYVVVFNGEIYNHRHLRGELERDGLRFRGHSDTETLLAAIDTWGLRRAVTRFNGMFSFALWDREELALSLVRDRVGIKPIYFGWTKAGFVFASELKGLRTAPGFCGEIDRNGVALLLRRGHVSAPHSICKGVFKLMPGSILRVDRDTAKAPLDAAATVLRAEQYWSASEVAKTGTRARFDGTEAEASAELDRLLRDAVALRMEADVPLGAFLSGGVDSSTVAALMQAQSGRPVKTFSIGFEESDFDEAKYAKAVSSHLGTDHSELYVSSREAMDVIPQLPEMYDEPFGDSSQIPTFLVSKLARNQVTVSLSGDGGDELFCGYERYFWLRRVWSKIGAAPVPVRKLAVRLLTRAPTGCGRFIELVAPLLPARFRLRSPREKAERMTELLVMNSPDALYDQLLQHWNGYLSPVVGVGTAIELLRVSGRGTSIGDHVERAMLADLTEYLPDDILTKVDRASMAVSLEARVPLLDHRVVEFAWRLPLDMKYRGGQGKWILRQVLNKYVQRELIERPKQGFGVPVGEWLRGPMRDWGEALLDESRLRRAGLLDPTPIRRAWSEHLSGARNRHEWLWPVLMFQAWLESA